ncbi:MAG: hypothetical protein HY868_26955 [Chloroflexi bacterium]|nr:hypothetical protein [Chloroflexota bacterium]
MPLIEKLRSDKWAGFALQELNIANGVFLNALRDVPGASEGFICDESGEILGAYVADEWNKIQAAELGAHLAQLLAAFHARDKKSLELELRGERGGIFMRDLGNAFAFVLCAPPVDWALLRMSVNVAAPTYEANAAVQSALQRAAQRHTQVDATDENNTPASGAWARFP